MAVLNAVILIGAVACADGLWPGALFQGLVECGKEISVEGTRFWAGLKDLSSYIQDQMENKQE